jgi:hypothetical protein
MSSKVRNLQRRGELQKARKTVTVLSQVVQQQGHRLATLEATFAGVVEYLEKRRSWPFLGVIRRKGLEKFLKNKMNKMIKTVKEHTNAKLQGGTAKDLAEG